MAGLVSPAIVLRKLDFSETSRIVWLFTREAGRLSALARGAHRPASRFQGALDLFYEIEAALAIKPERELQLLTGATVTAAHPGLGREPVRLAAASVLLELAGLALPEGRRDPPLYDLLAGGLALAEKFPIERIHVAVRAWQLRFLDLLGQGFALDRCAQCGEPLDPAVERAAFSTAAGGVLCPAHASEPGAAGVPRGVLLVLRAYRGSRARDLARLPLVNKDLGGAARLLDEALERRLEARSRAAAPFRALARATLGPAPGASS